MSRINAEESNYCSESNPLISIITVVYNGEEFLEDTIQSVINQDYKNIEYIIIDGGSTDGTIDIIKKYEGQLAYWISEPDNGIYDAMNKGIKLSQGKFIGIINSDDYYRPNALTLVANAFRDFDIVHGDMNIVDRKNGSLIRRRFAKEWKLPYTMSLNHPATFIKKEMYNEHLYSTYFKIGADYSYLLRAKLAGSKLYHIKEVLTFMRDGGVSNIEIELVKAELALIRKEHLSRSMYVFTSFVKQCKNGFLGIFNLFNK